VCGQGIRVSNLTLCVLSPVRIVKWPSECVVLAPNVARRLWPKSVKWCHKKLLDSAKSFVTNFQLKSAKSSEILLKNRLSLRWLKETYKVMQYSNLSSCTCSQWAWAEDAYLDHHNVLSVNILSNVTAAYLVYCMTHSSWRSLSNGCMFLYSRTMLSDKQSEHSFSPTTF